MGRTVWDLDVFHLSYRLSIQLHKATLEFPKIEQFGGIADQMRRSSKSVCANLIEGLGKSASDMDERRYLNIALGSASETILWLKYSFDLGYLAEGNFDAFDKEARRVCQMIRGLKNFKENKAA